MQIYIINLERSSTRREVMRERLNALGVQFQFVAAVDGKAGAHHLFPNYDPAFCLRAWRRPLSPGETGCFASHYQLWQHCVASNEPMIVMEDDVDVWPRFGEAVELLPGLGGHGYIRLSGMSSSRAFRDVPAGLPDDWKLVRFLDGPMGTQCYALFPGGAKRLLAGAAEWTMPVDNYMDSFWHHGVPCLGLLPFVTHQDRTGSDIRDMGGFHDPVWKPKRVAVRLMDSARRVAWNMAAGSGLHTGEAES